MDILLKAQDAVNRGIHASPDKRELVYIYISNVTDLRNIYKVGKTNDLARRQSEHRTACPDGVMAFYVYCDNAFAIETQLKNILKLRYRMSGEVVYDAPFDIIKQIIINLIEKERDNPLSIDQHDVQYATNRARLYHDPLHAVAEDEFLSERDEDKDKELEAEPNDLERTEKFLYRNLPGQQQHALGTWSATEEAQFDSALAKAGGVIAGNWGLFSLNIPTRVGYQCQGFYRRKLEDLGKVKNKNKKLKRNT